MSISPLGQLPRNPQDTYRGIRKFSPLRFPPFIVFPSVWTCPLETQPPPNVSSQDILQALSRRRRSSLSNPAALSALQTRNTCHTSNSPLVMHLRPSIHLVPPTCCYHLWVLYVLKPCLEKATGARRKILNVQLSPLGVELRLSRDFHRN